MSGPLVRALELLHRWLALDVSDGSDEQERDLTVEDDTSDLLAAYNRERAEREELVSEAVRAIPDAALQTWIDRGFTTVRPLAVAELRRRREQAQADEAQRAIRAHAMASLRKLESLR